MADYAKHNQFIENLAFGVHDFTSVSSAALTYWFTATDPSDPSAWAVIADVTGSVTTGLGALTSAAFTTSEGSSGSYLLLLPEKVFTGTEAVADFQYIGLYDTTPTSPLDPLICHWDYGSVVSGMGSGDTFTVTYTTSTFTLDA